MSKLPSDLLIHTAYVSTAGDMSVGIQPEQATISSPGDFLLDLSVLADDERGEAMEEFRKSLQQTFTSCWGEPASVVFEHEIHDEY